MRKNESQNKFRWEPTAKKVGATEGGENEKIGDRESARELSAEEASSSPETMPVDNDTRAEAEVSTPAPSDEVPTSAALDEAQASAASDVVATSIASDEVAPQAALYEVVPAPEKARKNPASASTTSLARMIRNEIPIEFANEKKASVDTNQDKLSDIAPEELAKIRDLVGTESDAEKNLSNALMSRKLDRAFKKEDGENVESDSTTDDEKVFESSRAPQTENVLKKSTGERLSAFLLRNPAVSASICLALLILPMGILISTRPKETVKPVAAEPKVAPTPTNLSAKQLIAHAKANYAKNNKITALNDLFAAAKLAPKDAAVYVARGDYYFNEKKLASAADDYKKALQLNPRIDRAQKQLSLCHAALATSAASKTKADKAPAISKSVMDEIQATDFDALRLKAYSALQAGKFEYAVVALSRCAQLRPNDPLTRRYLAFALLSNGELPLAIKQFHAWSRVDSASLNDKLKFGRALASAEGAEGNETTRQFFNSLVNDHSTEPDALLKIATTCYDLGFYDEPTNKAIQTGLRTGSNEVCEKLTALQGKIEAKQNAATQESAFKPLIKD